MKFIHSFLLPEYHMIEIWEIIVSYFQKNIKNKKIRGKSFLPSIFILCMRLGRRKQIAGRRGSLLQDGRKEQCGSCERGVTEMKGLTHHLQQVA